VIGTLWTFTVPFQGGLYYFEMRQSALSGSLHGEVVLPPTIPADTLPFGELHFKYETVGAEPPDIEHHFKQDLNAVVVRLEALARRAEAFNKDLRILIQSELEKRREKVAKDAAVSAALSIPLRPREGAPRPFSIPVQRRSSS